MMEVLEDKQKANMLQLLNKSEYPVNLEVIINI